MMDFKDGEGPDHKFSLFWSLYEGNVPLSKTREEVKLFISYFSYLNPSSLLPDLPMLFYLGPLRQGGEIVSTGRSMGSFLSVCTGSLPVVGTLRLKHLSPLTDGRMSP